MVTTDERKFTVVLPEGSQDFTMDEILHRADERNYKFWIIGGDDPVNLGGIVAMLEKEQPHEDWRVVGPFNSYFDAFSALTEMGRSRQSTYQYSQPWQVFINFLSAFAFDVKTGRRQA